MKNSKSRKGLDALSRKELSGLMKLGTKPETIKAWQVIARQALNGDAMMATMQRNILDRLEKDIQYIATLS